MKYLVKCERLDHFGRGIAYVDGKIVFVPNLLPLEEAYIDIIKVKKNYSIGRVVSLEKKSDDRVIPKCPYLNCGCALKHLRYEKQLAFKEDKVGDILKRYGHIQTMVRKIIPSDVINGYRNKITLKINGSVGYHENGSNNIITIDRCELASERVNELIKVLNSMDLSGASEIIIKDFDEIMLVIKGKIDITPLINLVGSIYMDDKLVYGSEFIKTKIDGLIFNNLPDAFFQVNSYMVDKLYDIVIKYCGDDYDKKVIDLYCGTGTITLLLGKYFKEVVGVEINKPSIECANINKKINGLDNVNFICGDVSLVAGNLDGDIVVVDPPRSGLSKEGIEDILKINPERLIYVSCDVMTLARDLNILKENYEVREVMPIDMFPNTYHVENVALLIRK